VAGNSSTLGIPDIFGTALAGSNNLVGNGTGLGGITNGSNGNQVGTATSAIDPLLSPLGSFGGPTQTMALLAGSLAIDAGSNASVTTTLPTPSIQAFATTILLLPPPTITGFSFKTGGFLPDNTTFYYRVSAVNQQGETLASAETSVTTPVTGNVNVVGVQWTAVPWATSYNVYGRTQGTEQLLATVTHGTAFGDDGSLTPSGALPTAITSLPANTTFYYRVSALNQQGETLASAETSITTGAQSANTVTVNWGAVPGATGYNVYGRTQGAEQLIATVNAATLSYTDDGSITPSGALPTANTTATLSVPTDQRGLPRIVNGTVDIGAFESNLQSQTITFSTLAAETYGNADFAISATASSGLQVSFTASGNASVYQDGGGAWHVHITGAGSATITAHQAGDGSYAPAPNVTQDLTINKATVSSFSITPYTSARTTYDGLAHTATGTATGVLGEDLSAGLTLSGTSHTNSGTYTGDPWSFHDASGNYQDASGTVNDSIGLALSGLLDWTGKRSYTPIVTASGGTGPYTFTLASGTLPTGLTLNANGTFSGAPTATGPFTFTLQASQGASAVGTRSYTLNIHAVPIISNLTVTQWIVGQSGFTGTMTIGNGTPQYILVGKPTGVPPGMTAVLSGNTISFTGTPGKAGTFKGKITIRDLAGDQVIKIFTIKINLH
jgi:hypothetical protein